MSIATQDPLDPREKTETNETELTGADTLAETAEDSSLEDDVPEDEDLEDDDEILADDDETEDDE